MAQPASVTGEPEVHLSSASGSLAILHPVRFQVVQRSSSGAGSIVVEGVYTGPPGLVEARFNGGAWTTLALVSATRRFDGTLRDQPAGQGTLDERLRERPTEIAHVNETGIGDIFIVAGQSSASGRGIDRQAYQHSTLKASMFAADYAWI